MFVSLSVAVALWRRLAQWTIVDLQSEDRTFQALFSVIKEATKYIVEIIFFNLIIIIITAHPHGEMVFKGTGNKYIISRGLSTSVAVHVLLNIASTCSLLKGAYT